jgi:hypothetical protein
MLWDFTPEIILEDREQKIYRVLRPAFFVLALFAGLYVATLILFPSQYFTFDFLNPNSTKNTLLSPRTENGSQLDHGRFPEQKSVIFSAPVTEKYSSAIISFTLSPKSAPFSAGKVSLKKAYQAFFYPEGEPLGLKNASLFEVGDNKYLLDEGVLRPFLSDEAYLSQFDQSQLISKDVSFLKTYPVSEQKIGFADGTLISSPDSIFIVNDGKILPIDSTLTFLANGFHWEDVIRASSDELSFYEKGKLFTLNTPHPNGIVFFATDEKRWFMVKDGQKLPLPSEKIMRSWTKQIPVDVTLQSLDITSGCELQKNIWPLRTYSCRIDLTNLQNLPGKDFQFETIAASEIKVDSISAQFIRDMNYDNFLFSSSLFYNRIKNNYAPVQ